MTYENSSMKKILIAATTVGAAVAGIILYSRKRNIGTRRIENAAKDTYATVNNGLGKIEKNAMHSMG